MMRSPGLPAMHGPAAAGPDRTAGSSGRPLGWGELYSFTLVSRRGPVNGTATLRADGARRAPQHQVATLVPGR